MSTRTLSVLLIAVVALGAATGAVAADEHELNVTVDDVDAEPVVTVTHNDTTAENASVNVTTDDENATYEGVGDYTTDENGTVALDAPGTNVTITVTAEYENETASTTANLTVAADDEEESEVRQPFGQQVREFIRDLKDDDHVGGIGSAVSDFVTGNNPGNAPDHAGNPHATNETANASDRPGNAPEHAGGPPEHAGPNHTETNESTDNGANGTEIDAADDAGNGNDDASGNSGTAGNGGPGNGGGPPSN